MASLKSYSYKGWGSWVNSLGVSAAQAIRVDNCIYCSGQGGWVPDKPEYDIDNTITVDLNEEIDQAFANVAVNLKDAGGKGWSQVYRVVTYSKDVPAQHDRIVYNIHKWTPNHAPVWTELGITHLGLSTMNFEIDVEAYDEEGAKEAKEAKEAGGAKATSG